MFMLSNFYNTSFNFNLYSLQNCIMLDIFGVFNVFNVKKLLSLIIYTLYLLK